MDAAGWSTSSSFTRVAQSLLTMILFRWFTTSLFIPLGPMEEQHICESL